MSDKTKSAVLRNIQNSDLYRHLSENKYRNLRTGAEGEIDEETAQRILKINLDATGLMNKFPMIEQLVLRLKLKGEIGK